MSRPFLSPIPEDFSMSAAVIESLPLVPLAGVKGRLVVIQHAFLDRR